MKRPIAAVVYAAEKLSTSGSNGSRIQNLVKLLIFGQLKGDVFSKSELHELSYAIASLRSKPDLLDDSTDFLEDYEKTKEAKTFINTLEQLKEEFENQRSE